MGTVVIERPLVGALTGSEILRRGGWPRDGVGSERIARLEAALQNDPWLTGQTDRASAEARFRRLQQLCSMAHSIRHARQCTRLGEPLAGTRHLAHVFPGKRLRYAVWRAYGKGQLTRNALSATLDLLADERRRNRLPAHRASVLAELPEPLRRRVEAAWSTRG